MNCYYKYNFDDQSSVKEKKSKSFVFHSKLIVISQKKKKKVGL